MIEPSRLVSRLMIFVLAGSLATMVILIITLTEMFPLKKTQIFFLESKPNAEQTISISDFNVNPTSLENYKENFLKEYIVERNQIIPSNQVMQIKWRADGNGTVYSYSSDDIYAKFIKTDLWNAVMTGKYEQLTFKCDISFTKIVPLTANKDKYTVKFRYICGDDSTGQSVSKDFTIAIGLEFKQNVQWNERLSNPLGLKVISYDIENGAEDPLNVL